MRLLQIPVPSCGDDEIATSLAGFISRLGLDGHCLYSVSYKVTWAQPLYEWNGLIYVSCCGAIISWKWHKSRVFRVFWFDPYESKNRHLKNCWNIKSNYCCKTWAGSAFTTNQLCGIQGNLNSLVLREHFFWLCCGFLQNKNFAYKVLILLFIRHYRTFLVFMCGSFKLNPYVWKFNTMTFLFVGVDELTTEFWFKRWKG